jgi:hypothetical protein
MLRATFLVALLVGYPCSEVAKAAPVREDVKPPSELAKAKVTAAQTAYERFLALYENDPQSVDVEKIYVWSRRWMEAQSDLSERKEDRLAAAEAHFERMKRLETQANRNVESGKAKQESRFGVEFYRVEAQAWVMEKKK